MGFTSSPAARRMMKALCCCDNRQIREAVHRYTGELNDAEMIKLLQASHTYLDPYHRVVLESLLNSVSLQDPYRDAQIKTKFESFVAENPRALEQLPPRMIEGILQRATQTDANLRRQFTPAPIQRYVLIISGMGGAFTAALVGIAYIYFGSPKMEESIITPPSISLKADVKQPPALVRAVRTPHRYARGALATSAQAAHNRIFQTNSTLRSSVTAAITPAHSDAIARRPRRQLTRRSLAERITNHRVSKAMALLPTVASRPPHASLAVEKASLPPGISGETVAVDTMKVVTQTVESTEVEASTPATDPAPARYCYARGSWRAC